MAPGLHNIYRFQILLREWPMINEDPSFSDNKREYSRVDAYIPLECKLVTVPDKGSLRSRLAGESLLAEFKELPNPDDQLMAQWLQNINAKLDEIIRMLTIQHDGFNCLSITKVNISGGGMSFNTGKCFSPGDILEVKVMLNLQKPFALFLYGEVLAFEIPHPEYDTNLQFIHMDESIRDEIVRFVFETEREILRGKRR
jgi:hypothetical protein